MKYFTNNLYRKKENNSLGPKIVYKYEEGDINFIGITKPPYMVTQVGNSQPISDKYSFLVKIFLDNSIKYLHQKLLEFNKLYKDKEGSMKSIYVDNIKLCRFLKHWGCKLKSNKLLDMRLIFKDVRIKKDNKISELDYQIFYFLCKISSLLKKKSNIKVHFNKNIKFIHKTINLLLKELKKEQDIETFDHIEQRIKKINIDEHVDNPKNIEKNNKRSVQGWLLKWNSDFVEKGKQKEKQKILPIEEDFGICNRLDIDTSGIIITAFNKKTFCEVRQKINSKKYMKIYIALLNGKLDKIQLIKNTIGRAKFKKFKGIQRQSAYNTIKNYTEPKHVTKIIPYKIYKTEKNNETKYYTLTLVRILTGTHHQIRTHCHDIGYPIVSDNIYTELYDSSLKLLNDNLQICPRLFLHSVYYSIQINRKQHDIFAELHDDLSNCLNNFDIVKKNYKHGIISKDMIKTLIDKNIFSIE
jgi:23S rRNA-/tRNA-specific pseudouridylate synthase